MFSEPRKETSHYRTVSAQNSVFSDVLRQAIRFEFPNTAPVLVYPNCKIVPINISKRVKRFTAVHRLLKYEILDFANTIIKLQYYMHNQC